MERLRKEDAEEGVTTRPMTDEQKGAIAEVRSLYDSKLAEQDILQQSAMNGMLSGDPAELEEVRPAVPARARAPRVRAGRKGGEDSPRRRLKRFSA